VIKSFRCRETERLFLREPVKKIPQDLQRSALRKLLILHAEASLDDLRSPPGNRLEASRGNRTGQHSIRINDQWRVCFVWQESNAWEVEIVDYH
jgi:toxin HigB-1